MVHNLTPLQLLGIVTLVGEGYIAATWKAIGMSFCRAGGMMGPGVKTLCQMEHVCLQHKMERR